MYVPLNKYFQIDKKGTNFHYHLLRVTQIIMTNIVKIEIIINYIDVKKCSFS